MIELVVSSFLKGKRKNSKFTAKEVSERLKEYGFEINKQTIYGYESGLSMPNADVFVALCQIYNCTNPLGVFGSPSYSKEELEMIEKYRYIKEKAPEQSIAIPTLINGTYDQLKKAEKEKRDEISA